MNQQPMKVAPGIIVAGITSHLKFMMPHLVGAKTTDLENMRQVTIDTLKAMAPGLSTLPVQQTIDVGRQLADYVKKTFRGDEIYAADFIKTDPGMALIGMALLTANPDLGGMVKEFQPLALRKKNGAHPAADADNGRVSLAAS